MPATAPLTMPGAARPPAPVAARRTALDLGGAPVHWLDGDTQSTHTMNVGNLLFPTGERFFNDSVRNALPYVTDERVRADIRGFLGQEVTHANAHERCVQRMRDHGIDFDAELDRFERVRRRLNAAVESTPEPFRRQAVLLMLAVTAAAEHVTASLAGYVLEDNTWSEGTVDPDMRNLFLWHAAEEIEHRHVAFDAYEHVGGGYVRRAVAMVAVGGAVMAFWPLLTTLIMRRDPQPAACGAGVGTSLRPAAEGSSRCPARCGTCTGTSSPAITHPRSRGRSTSRSRTSLTRPESWAIAGGGLDGMQQIREVVASGTRSEGGPGCRSIPMRSERRRIRSRFPGHRVTA